VTSSKACDSAKKPLSDDFPDNVHEIIQNANKAGKPLSLRKIQNQLQEDALTITRKTLRRRLLELGYFFGSGEQRNILYETPHILV
jgi:DNA-directed RNA polymerase specialized sigma54-like protein